MISVQPPLQTPIQFILARIAWNSVGFAFAVLVASAVTVTTLMFVDAPHLIVVDPQNLLSRWFNLFLMGCCYTATMALPSSVVFVAMMEWADIRLPAVYMFAGAAASICAHLTLAALGVGILSDIPIVMSSVLGGASGGYVLWRVAR